MTRVPDRRRRREGQVRGRGAPGTRDGDAIEDGAPRRFREVLRRLLEAEYECGSLPQKLAQYEDLLLVLLDEREGGDWVSAVRRVVARADEGLTVVSFVARFLRWQRGAARRGRT